MKCVFVVVVVVVVVAKNKSHSPQRPYEGAVIS
jgi:hypothetical protein